MFRRASSRGLRDICFSKWSDSIFEFILENILAYFYSTSTVKIWKHKNINRWDFEKILDFQDPAFFFRNSTHLEPA